MFFPLKPPFKGDLEVSIHGDTPKSSMLIEYSIINQAFLHFFPVSPHFRTPPYGFYMDFLVGGWATPLKNISQLG